MRTIFLTSYRLSINLSRIRCEMTFHLALSPLTVFVTPQDGFLSNKSYKSPCNRADEIQIQ